MSASSVPMTRTERVRAALRGDAVDRLPVVFWHHFGAPATGLELADATLEFFDRRYDLDVCKLMPDLPYPLSRNAVRQVRDWRLIEPLNPDRSRFIQERVRAIAALRAALGPGTPIVVTMFSPLAEAMYAAASHELFYQHLVEAPVAVHGALGTIAANLGDAIERFIEAGADGVFFAVQGATENELGDARYREFGRPYDLLALGHASGGWLNMLHMHGDRGLLIDTVLDYPVAALSWSDRLAGPDLATMRGKTNLCLMGGWHESGALANGPADEIRREAEDAIAQTDGRGLILANGCSVPDGTSPELLRAAREIAGALSLP